MKIKRMAKDSVLQECDAMSLGEWIVTSPMRVASLPTRQSREIDDCSTSNCKLDEHKTIPPCLLDKCNDSWMEQLLT
jgi:hypothetical protein